MILLVLVVLWAAVLAPGLLKRRSERHSAESIESFHYQLHLLERGSPRAAAPAYRLQTAESHTGMAVGQSGFPAITSMPGRPNLVLLHREEGDQRGVEASGLVPAPRQGDPAEPRTEATTAPGADLSLPTRIKGPDPYRRKMAARRRRTVLAWLLGTTGCSGLLGFVPSLGAMWIVTLISAVALAAYVTLLVYAQNLTAGRAGQGFREVVVPGVGDHRAGSERVRVDRRSEGQRTTGDQGDLPLSLTSPVPSAAGSQWTWDSQGGLGLVGSDRRSKMADVPSREPRRAAAGR